MFICLIISRQVTEDKQKKTSSNAIILTLHVLVFFLFLLSEKKERNVYGDYRQESEVNVHGSATTLQIFYGKKRKERRKEIKANSMLTEKT